MSHANGKHPNIEQMTISWLNIFAANVNEMSKWNVQCDPVFSVGSLVSLHSQIFENNSWSVLRLCCYFYIFKQVHIYDDREILIGDKNFTAKLLIQISCGICLFFRFGNTFYGFSTCHPIAISLFARNNIQ